MKIINYSTKKFCDIYPDVNTFKTDFNTYYPLLDAGNFYTIEEAYQGSIFYLLFAKFGNNPIANMDETQFKIKLFAIVYQHAPRYLKELDVQKKLLGLSEEEMATGAKTIFNHAYNPSGNGIYTDSLDGLDYINEQNATNFKKGKIDAYMALLDMLRDDFTDRFLNKFRVLFKVSVGYEDPAIYIYEEDEEEEGES